MLHTANAGTIYIPTIEEILGGYSLESGFNPKIPNTDQGAVESEVNAFMATTGIAGHKSSAHAPIDPSNINHLKWGIILFGGVRLGINVQSSTEIQFDNNQPWAPAAGDVSEGGHDVYLDYYEKSPQTGLTMWQVCSWGRGRHPMTDAFRALHVEESHGEVYFDWIKQGGLAPNNFDLPTLTGKLISIRG